MSVYLWADPHFGHKNIIKYENRPFSSVEEMDEALINNWNSVVSKDSIGIMLGDLSFHSISKTSDIVQRLNGTLWLITGNHDSASLELYKSMGFYHVYDKPVIYMDYFILSHKPLYINENMPYINIFGHVHSQKQYVDFSTQSYCVSVERIGYKPILFNQIVREIRNLDK